ncbi:MAG: carboxypeptidase-like regulatory domain-containing protein [Ignavibacteriaceae bacterium]|jgi:hypothetical protein|nr:carboxypeptidase-like regulatory domain-containing protein [Ignavibacteriaceae bacterium]
MRKQILYLFFLLSISVFSQKYEFIQFSGAVVTGDSLNPVPFTHIIVKGTSRGTISNINGFFSFVAQPNDIVIFSSIGLKKGYYKIPDTLSADNYTMFQVMQPDTIFLPETVIYPWPSPTNFKNAFISLNVPDDDYDRALKNIALLSLKDSYLKIQMDGSINYKNFIQEKIENYYTMGQMPVNNLLNPFAWAQFFKAWQNGEFKRKNNNFYPPD